jgi:hypothetical protein
LTGNRAQNKNKKQKKTFCLKGVGERLYKEREERSIGKDLRKKYLILKRTYCTKLPLEQPI